MSQNDGLTLDIDTHDATGNGGGKAAPIRKCILTGTHGGREALIIASAAAASLATGAARGSPRTAR